MNAAELDAIRTHWDRRAAQEGDNPNFTLPDYHLRSLEAGYILRHLRPEDRALDIGCGNGATTVRFAAAVRSIVGADFAPVMIEKARRLSPGPNIEYRVLDVREIDVPDASFDVVISERCVINLPDWPAQQGALHEIHRVLKPGGRLLLSESFEEAFVKFGETRKQFGLAPMKRHWNNRLVREAELAEFLPSLFRVRAVEKMGIYYLVSRLAHPLLVAPMEPAYEAALNDIAVKLALALDPNALADLSVNGLYVLEKPAA